MTLVDLNVLLYAMDDRSPHHHRARAWLEEALSGGSPVLFAWVVVLGFVRLSTKPAAFANPLDPAEALDIVDGWLARPVSRLVDPTPRHTAILAELLAGTGTAGNLTTDAHLAALSIEHGAHVCSFDTDFSRFPGVRWFSPPQR